MAAKKICLISDLHLSTNPRTWKEAKTLASHNYDVTIITMFHSPALRERDKELLAGLPAGINYRCAASYINGEMPRLKSLWRRGIGKLARLIKKLDIDTPYLLNNNPGAIIREALKVSADLYICHADCSLYIGKKLIEKGKNVAFDIEDWYSNDYLVSTRPVRLLKQLEKFALENGAYVTCPSNAMAEAMHKEYGGVKPEVIYNGFPIEPLPANNDSATPSLVWFSQTIGPGRGLEKIIGVLQHIQSPLSLTLVGDISEKYRSELEALFGNCRQHKLIILPQVKHTDLHALLTQHTIGLALEENFPANKDTTISNKILQYLQAGLSVLATGTAGQKEVAVDFRDVVAIVPPDDTGTWGIELQKLISQGKTIKEDIIVRFNNKYSWEAQEGKLLDLVAGALKINSI